ncbi:type II toxin-antitoxin system PemK/MazF family toxin [Candidatus Gracilibacteria bacterium]|nr:type II toxin-antitoxin system PemK/MazF family toxin [Candidatus Gracilibacteria bacterium]
MKEYIIELKKWFEEKIFLHNDLKSQKNIFKQKEIYYVNFGINIGSEFNLTRPALIFEKSKFSFWRKNVIVIPITTYKNNKKYNKFDIKINKSEINGLKEDSILKLLHIKDICKSRVKTKLGTLEKQDFEKVQNIFEKIYK